MRGLVRLFGDDAEGLLALTPEELGLAMLPQLRERQANRMSGGLNIGSLVNELNPSVGEQEAPFGSRNMQVKRAVMEALSWLESEVLLVREEGTNGNNGWRILSRRAEALTESADEVAHYRAAKALPKHLVHPAIADQVWRSFLRGEYDTAAFQAMRQVEIATREASGAQPDWPGVKMARWAFKPGPDQPGPLADLDAEAGEQQGMMDLFAGALGALKNPHSHRVVNFRSPAEAAAVILTASQLLRIVENAKAARDLLS
ncbi:TIGR02391 family protein [Phenylobacterium sp.]|uniref:TIGR02391 family protein n=1 Tax=Phenylobacterium sp. TaxID=1871053 RepID=UPI003D266FD9